MRRIVVWDPCSVSGCARTVQGGAKGYCKPHYDRWLHYGDPERPNPRVARACSVPRCGVRADARGLCPKHYAIRRHHGDPLWVKPIPKEKVCTACRVLRPLRAFSTDARHDDGRQSHCLQCALAYKKVHAQKYPDRLALSKEKDTLKRRARRLSLPCEAFSVGEIGERDGWLCGICGLAIDPALRFPAKYSRSIDHILHLSRGGHHTRANVRITHWICNVARGSRMLPSDRTAVPRLDLAALQADLDQLA